MVAGHCQNAGHGRLDSTVSFVKEQFGWKHIGKDCPEFINSCLHCFLSKTGHMITRPLSMRTHTNTSNVMVHFDCLYMGPGLGNIQYVLVIQDKLSSYRWLSVCTQPESSTTALIIAGWIQTFTAMNVWVSDQSSHSKNCVMEDLAKHHRIKHTFTVAYYPWISGTVENAMKHVRAAVSVLFSEQKLGTQDLPLVLEVVMTALNELPLPRLEYATTRHTAIR